MKNKLKFLTAFAFLSVGAVNAQIGIGNPSPKATLDVTGTPATATTADGIIAPRLTGDQLTAKTAYGADQTGAIVYVTAAAAAPAGATVNVTAAGFYYFDGTAWQKVGGGTSKFVDGTTATDAVYTAGNVGIGITSPNTNAALDVTATNKGILLPRVALTSLTSPAPLSAFVPGMQVFNTNTAGTAPNNVTPGVYVADTNAWVKQVANIYGSRGDVTVTGNPTNATFTINNTVVNSQKLATSLKVGGGTPASSSVALEVTGGTKGFVVSTTNNINGITDPVVGMMVYSTTENCLRIYTATGWSNCLLTAAGNASTNGSGIVSTYGAGVDKSVTPVYGKKVASTLTTTSVATVGTAGGYSIIASSTTLPGLIFSSTGTFTATGSQTVTLTASGAIDTAHAGTTHTFTSNTSPSFTFTLTVAPMTYVTSNGNTFNAFYNGHVDNLYTGTTSTAVHTAGEVFSTNVDCVSKTISQTSPADCTGSVTGTSGTNYPLVWINGQCWFQTNLKEVPTNFPDAPNTGNNIWLNTSSTDLGLWGYYNSTTTNGTAGWGTAEPAAGEGILYQWSAAMNGSIIERSQGVCPNGFHIPSDCEWMFLEHGVGMNISEQNKINIIRANTDDNQGAPGYKLRSVGSGQNNASGFSGLLTGFRSPNGTFLLRSSRGHSWTSSASETNAASANTRYIASGNRGVFRSPVGSGFGLGVRCLKN